MIADALLPLLLIAAVIYAKFLFDVQRGLNRLSSGSGELPNRFVSVVVATRNEEHTIEACLSRLSKQEFPPDHFEVIIVDDHSSDRTVERAAAFAAAHPVPLVRILTSEGAGKPSAIAMGVREAKGSIILSTDADCQMTPGWIAAMAGRFDDSVAFVAGPVVEERAKGFWGRIANLEFLGLITTAAGLIGTGKPIICHGANMGFLKSAFEEVEGYGGNSSPCSDETLMQRIAYRRAGMVVFTSDPRARVITKPDRSLRSFWRRRTRWAAKRGRYEDRRILWRLIALYAFFVLLFSGAVLAAFSPALRLPVLLVLVGKALLEYRTLTLGARAFTERVSFSHFVVAELFHVPYIVLATAAGQLRPIRWKGRIFTP